MNYHSFLILIFINSICFSHNLNLKESKTINYQIKELEGYLFFHYVNEDYEQVKNFSEQIKVLDENIYRRDTKILKYWDYIDNIMPLNIGVAPDGIPNRADHAFVVLGYALNPDGSLNQEAMGRCDVAYESAMKYPNSLIFVTGGGTAKNNKNVTEGGQMKEYLVNIKGLDESRIVLEAKAMNTVQNIIYTIEKLVEHHIKTITVITSDYHIRRGCILFEGEAMLMPDKYGIEPIQILENAVWETGKQTEGKLFEGFALTSILDVIYPLDLLIKNLPKIIFELIKFCLQRFL